MILRKTVISTCTALLAIGLAACSGDSDSSASTTTTASAGTTSTSSITSSAVATTAAAFAPSPTSDELKATLELIADPTKSTQEKASVIVDGEDMTAELDQMNAGLAAQPRLLFESRNVGTAVVRGNPASGEFLISAVGKVGASQFDADWEPVDGVWKLQQKYVQTFISYAKGPEERTPIRPR